MVSHPWKLKVTSFWDIALRSLVEVDGLFRDGYCLHHQDGDNGALIMVAVCASGMLVYFYYTAQYPRRLPSSYSLP
jgi:hypothetical protein